MRPLGESQAHWSPTSATCDSPLPSQPTEAKQAHWGPPLLLARPRDGPSAPLVLCCGRRQAAAEEAAQPLLTSRTPRNKVTPSLSWGDPATATLSEPGSRQCTHSDPRSSPQRHTLAVPTPCFTEQNPEVRQPQDQPQVTQQAAGKAAVHSVGAPRDHHQGHVPVLSMSCLSLTEEGQNHTM